MKTQNSWNLEQWSGRVATAIPVAVLILSAIAKITLPPGEGEAFAKFGYDTSQMTGIAVLELVCTAAYLVPSSSVLGAILLSGYFGGAIASHVRIHDAFFGPLVLALLVWGGLWLREPRLRAWLPTRS